MVHKVTNGLQRFNHPACLCEVHETSLSLHPSVLFPSAKRNSLTLKSVNHCALMIAIALCEKKKVGRTFRQ